MYSRAAFVAAPRAAARPSVAKPVDLDLSGPGCECPVEFGGGSQGPDSVPIDLSVSLALHEREVLPPTDGAPSIGHQNFRLELVETAHSAFATGATLGTVRTYEATLRAIAPKVTANLGPKVLPVSPEAVLYAFFSSTVPLELRKTRKGRRSLLARRMWGPCSFRPRVVSAFRGFLVGV